MNAYQIYKTVLEQLASGGSVEAKMALSLGEQPDSPNVNAMINSVSAAIRSANQELGRALSHNDDRWTKETDRAIERARDSLSQALIFLATK
jgi:hypothetical protein